MFWWTPVAESEPVGLNFRHFDARRSAGPRGHRAYAVGDIHGRLDLLQSLLDLIEKDVRRRRAMRTSIVFLGDLIDRGPDSAGVVELLRTYRPSFAKTMFLMGNHEEVMLRVLAGDTGLLGQWMQFGGAECIHSYGLQPEALKRMQPDSAIELLKTCIPPMHVEFLESFADSIGFGSYLFVHAGIRPGIGLADQSQADLRWIRQPFLDDQRDHGQIIVHGHTIREEVELCSNRIGIDTGAYRTGVLTALGIERTERWLIQTTGDMIDLDEVARSGLANRAKHR